jgi:hypothetical protein
MSLRLAIELLLQAVVGFAANRKESSVKVNRGSLIYCSLAFLIKSAATLPDIFYAPMRRLTIIIAFLAAYILSATSSIAEESAAARCSAKLRKFVTAIDRIFAEDPGSVEDYYGPIRDYLSGTGGCNVDEVISISKKSKFFSELGEEYTTYVIVFYGNGVTVSFGLKKNTGNIETPAAYTQFL